MKPFEYYQAGQLNAAVTAALAAVKSAPNDTQARRLLAELLCFAGDLERADKQLDALGQLDVMAMPDIALFRQLLRADGARAQLYNEGRLPEFLSKPGDEVQARLEALVQLRAGQPARAMELLAQAEAQRRSLRGKWDDQPFEGIRDLDDICASVFEVLTSTGKYYWIPMESVEFMEFHPRERIRDRLWTRVHMIVRGGPDGEVFLPTLYANTATCQDDQVRLGRFTDWPDAKDGPTRGLGLREFLVGDEPLPILKFKKLEFEPD